MITTCDIIEESEPGYLPSQESLMFFFLSLVLSSVLLSPSLHWLPE